MHLSSLRDRHTPQRQNAQGETATNEKGRGRRKGGEGVHLSSLRTDTPRNGKLHKVEPKWMKRGQTKKGALRLAHNQNLQKGGGLRHAASETFQIVMFVGFKSGSPTVFKSKRHRARCFLNGGKSSKLSALCLKLIYVTQRWPFSDSSAREFPSLHMLPQRSFKAVVSR